MNLTNNFLWRRILFIKVTLLVLLRSWLNYHHFKWVVLFDNQAFFVKGNEMV
jgi:hypothetical protein